MIIRLKRFNEEVDRDLNMSDENVLRMLSTLLKLGERDILEIGYVEPSDSKNYYADLITDWGKIGFKLEDEGDIEPGGINEWRAIETLTRNFENSQYQLKVACRFRGSDYDDLQFEDYEEIISLIKTK